MKNTNDGVQRENAKFQGTPVNKDSFLAWKKTFDAEMAAIKAKEKERALLEMKRRKLNGTLKETESRTVVKWCITLGRQLFESDKSMMASEVLDEGDEVVEVDENALEYFVEQPEEDDQDRSFLYED